MVTIHLLTAPQLMPPTLSVTFTPVRLSRVFGAVIETDANRKRLLGMAHKFVTAHDVRRPTSRNRRKPA